jgi:hypothetical protein
MAMGRNSITGGALPKQVKHDPMKTSGHYAVETCFLKAFSTPVPYLMFDFVL